MNKIKLSIIIPTYNRKDMLKECVCSLIKQTYSKSKYEIIVVDDGSTDRTDKLVQDIQKDNESVRYYKQENQGPAAARNLGASNSNGEILVFTDSDCVTPPEFLEKIIDCFKRHPEVSACGGQNIPFFTSSFFNNLSEYYEMLYKKGKKKDKVFFQLEPMALVNTGRFSIKKDVFQKVKGFNPKLKWNAGEDPDLGFKLLKNKYSICFTDSFFVYHHERGGCIDEIKRWYFFGVGDGVVTRKYFKKQFIVEFFFNKAITILNFPTTVYIHINSFKIIILLIILVFYCKIGIVLMLLYFLKRFIMIRKIIKKNVLKTLFLYDFLRFIREAAFFFGSAIGSVKNRILKF